MAQDFLGSFTASHDAVYAFRGRRERIFKSVQTGKARCVKKDV